MNMPKHQTLGGEVTDDADPKRGVWFSSRCTYWTDDWTKLRYVACGLPVCPCCGSPGCQIEYGRWLGYAIEFERSGHPDYLNKLLSTSEVCSPRVKQNVHLN